MMVDIEAVKAFTNIVPLQDVRENAACENMLLVRKGQRLSVQPVDEGDFEIVLAMGGLALHQL